MSSIKPWEHQLEIAGTVIEKLKKYALVYLAMEERTGKSLIGILVCEELEVQDILIVTKLNSMEGWHNILDGYDHMCEYTVINYHSVDKAKGDYDLIILDEPHAYISSYPKPSKIWHKVQKFTRDKPIIYMSATPNAQGFQLLFHQLHLSTWSPWRKWQNFYSWFKHFAKRDKEGNIVTKYVNANLQVVDYTKLKDEDVFAGVKHLFITRTRKELNFEHEPEDIVHYVELSDNTKAAYNILMKHKVLEFTHKETGNDYKIVCDTVGKLKYALHMIEGGGIKVTVRDKKKTVSIDYLALGNTEKIDYIKDLLGDTKDIVIMYEYKSDLLQLERNFDKVRLLQATSYAEGVDLSMYKHLVIYSQNFSTSKHVQRRCRQANKNRKEEIKVHFLLVKKAVSSQVYKTVSKNKENYVDSLFERKLL